MKVNEITLAVNFAEWLAWNQYTCGHKEGEIFYWRKLGQYEFEKKYSTQHLFTEFLKDTGRKLNNQKISKWNERKEEGVKEKTQGESQK